ncbi:MAG TPA: type 1 glutamine amidotransferase [Polyangia bacterium]|nr:type 1 glutamine amidotransferase [Polyangia bacterium]
MRVLVLQHAEHEGPALVGEALRARGAALEIRRTDRGEAVPASARGWDLVVAMGGAMAAWDDAAHPFLAGEARLLGEAARAGVAVLGVCLGAQLLARGLGARVYRGPRLELGLAPIALTAEGRADALLAPLDGRDVVHWHHDTFDLPAGAVRLASTADYPNQAFRFGARAYGVQFHIELDRAARRAWAEPGAAELCAAGVAPADLDGDEALDERGRAFARAVCEELASGRRQ